MKFLKFFLIYTISLVAVLLLIEFFLQMAEVEIAYHKMDPYVGKDFQKDRDIMYLNDGFYMGASNKYGYLGPAFPEEKEDNVFRIALMGDSYAEGFHVFEEYHFRNILEKELNKFTGKEVQVLNFGGGDLTFEDMYIHYLYQASKYKPDMLLFLVANADFADKNRNFSSPYFYIDNRNLAINDQFRKKRAYKTFQKFSLITENSSMVKMLMRAYKLSRKKWALNIIFDKFAPTPAKLPNQEGDYDRPPENIAFSEVKQKILQELGKDKNVYFAHRLSFTDSTRHYLDSLNIKSISLNDTLSKLRATGIETHYWKGSHKYGHWNHVAQEAVGLYLASILKKELPYNRKLMISNK